MDNKQQSKELIDPILDLMTGADGGVAFARLHHSTLPYFIAQAEKGDPQAIEMIKCFTKVSKLCRILIDTQA